MKEDYLDKKLAETLSSLDGIEGADPGDFFAAKTVQRMKNRQSSNQPMTWVWKTAIAGLVLVNLSSLVLYNQTSVSTTQGTVTELSDEYFSSDLGINDIEIML